MEEIVVAGVLALAAWIIGFSVSITVGFLTGALALSAPFLCLSAAAALVLWPLIYRKIR